LNPVDSGAGDVMENGFAGLNRVSGNLEDRNSAREIECAAEDSYLDFRRFSKLFFVALARL